MQKNTIYGINGPVVTVKNTNTFSMLEMVYVGNENLIGEVISVTKETTTIQVYEVTTGLRPGEPVTSSGSQLSVTLGPGLINNIFDGIERPLRDIFKQNGAFISRGSMMEALDVEKVWEVEILINVGDRVSGGQVYATTKESDSVQHKMMISPIINGEVIAVKPNGGYTVHDTIATIKTDDNKQIDIDLTQKWPIRVPRPISQRINSRVPLLTGQRVIDTILPIAKGGTVAIPGGFGTGKTMTQHQIAKWCDADIIIYVGCGERGNEMTQVLDEFSELIDPRTQKKLTERIILIANTSNMPVAAREASIYTGITLAEYYRDMGYDVAMMADSTSRWAEALREISGRLEEMPAEEGFPAYLPSRLSQFYERAGMVEALCGKKGSITVIGAVSPQGADFSEPVTQNTKRFTRAFLALDKALAYSRHYPAINWLTSYSEYDTELEKWFIENVDKDFMEYRKQIIALLRQESELMEIVKLIGSDVLPEDQKLTIEIAKVIRVGFLQQNAFHKDDTYVPLIKQFKMMEIILYLYRQCKLLLEKSIPISLVAEKGLFDRLIKIKYTIDNEHMEAFDELKSDIDKEIKNLLTN